MATNDILCTYTLDTGQKLQVVRGDLTAENVDAIVNAANEGLVHGGGVAGAIARAGGRVIQRESREWVRQHGRVRTGSAAITGGGTLAARYVIHAVGPVWRERGDEPELLRAAVQQALTVADENDVASIAMPAISSGIFGFPKQLAAKTITGAVEDYFATHPGSGIEVVRFCNGDAKTSDLFLVVMRDREQKRGQIRTGEDNGSTNFGH